jgi:thiol-disulfide isomerase/thioredoxin
LFTIKPLFESKNFTYNTQAAQDKFLMISVYEHFKADFIFNNRTYSIYVSNKRVSPYFENDNGTFILMKSSDTTVVLKIGTPAKIDDLIVEPVFISEYADTLKLNISDTLLSRNISGTNVGFMFPDMNLTDVKNKQLHLPIKGKYNLLDFWGTWCGPCKALTPALKQISDKKNTMLDIISIAYDDDSINVIKYIKEKDMNWYHCIANKNNNNIKIIETCDLTSYPTFILINPVGIVIGKYIGMNGFEKLKLKLDELGFISL